MEHYKRDLLSEKISVHKARNFREKQISYFENSHVARWIIFIFFEIEIIHFVWLINKQQ